MSQVYDSHYQRIVDVADKDWQADPGRFQAVADQQIPMIGPDGKQYNVTGTSAQDAVNAGYSFAPDEQAQVNRKVDYYRELHGGAIASVDNSIDNLLMGVPDAIMGGTESAEETLGRSQAREKEKSEHPWRYYGLGGAGIAANMALTAGVGAEVNGATKAAVLGSGAAQATVDAVAPGLLRRMAASVAGNAAEAGLYSAPASVAQLITGDPSGAAETLGTGMALGGLFGAAGDAVGAAWKHFSGISKADRAILAARGITDESGNVLPEGLAKLKSEVGTAERGIHPDAVAKVLGPDAGSQIESLATTHDIKSFTPENLTSISEKINSDLAEHSKDIQKLIGDSAKKTVEELTPARLTQAMQDAILESRPGMMPKGVVSGPEALQEFLNTQSARETMLKMSHSINEMGSEPVALGKWQDKLNQLTKDVTKIKDPLAQQVGQQALDVLGTQTNAAKAKILNMAKTSTEDAAHLNLLEQKKTVDGLLKLGPEAFLESEPVRAARMSELNIGEKAGLMSGRRLTRGIVGGAIGGAVGDISDDPTINKVGHVAGFVAGTLTGTALQKRVLQALGNRTLDYAGSSGALGLSSSVLKKVVKENPEWLGMALTKNANQASQGKLGLLREMFSALPAKAAEQSTDPIKNALGMQSSGLTKAQQFEKLSDMLNSAKADPNRLQSEISSIQNVFGHDPQMQTMLGQQHSKTLDYLYGSLPKAAPNAPFQKQPNQVSGKERKDFTDKLEVAQNPFMVLVHARNGTLTPAHIDALQNLYPQLRQGMKDQIGAWASDPKAPALPGGVKQALGMISGVPMTAPSQTNFQQMVYGGGAPPIDGSGGGKGKGQHGTSKPNVKLPNLSTPSQKIQFKL